MMEFIKVGSLKNSQMRKDFPLDAKLFPKGKRTDVYVMVERESRVSWPIPGT